MIIQVVLIIGFAAGLLLFLTHQGSYQMKAWMKVFSILFTFVAVAAILFPDSLNWIAHKAGVKRGADLLFYLLTMAFIFNVLQTYMKDKQDQRRLVQLVRRVAILEAELKQTPDHHA